MTIGSATAQESPSIDPFSSQNHESDLSSPSEVNCANLLAAIQSQMELNELYRSLMQVSLNRAITTLSNEQMTPQQIEKTISDIYAALERMENIDSKLDQLADNIKAAVSSCLSSSNKE